MQYSKLLSRSAAQTGLIGGTFLAAAFGLFIGLALQSAVLGLIEGIVFGVVSGAFFAWRVHEHHHLAHWSMGLTVAAVVGIAVALALYIESLVLDNVRLAIAWD